MRVEWSFTSETMTALLAELYHTEGDVQVVDVEHDELADTVVVGLEVGYEDWKLMDQVGSTIGEFQN